VPEGWVPEFEGQRPPFQPGIEFEFQPGHELSIEHGAFSPRKVDPLARELVDQVLANPDLTHLTAPQWRAALWAWGRAEAQCQLLSEYLIKAGEDAGDGVGDLAKRRVRTAYLLLHRAEARANTQRTKLGLDPLSAAKLGRYKAAGAVDVARLMAEMERRERGRRWLSSRRRCSTGQRIRSAASVACSALTVGRGSVANSESPNRTIAASQMLLNTDLGCRFSRRRGAMRGRSVLIAGLAIAGTVLASTPALARPIDKGHFHDVFTSDVYDCDGTPAQDAGDISGNFLFNQRGSSPFPYYRESVHGTIVTTNLETGGTYTNVFTGNSKDQVITDNGDGTITITVFASGGSRFYDTDGNFVLKDPGEVRFAFDVDYNGTPGDPSDDVEVPGSFRVVRSSTGNSDLSDRDFCADLVEFTS
jgi:hypothetical protein